MIWVRFYICSGEARTKLTLQDRTIEITVNNRMLGDRVYFATLRPYASSRRANAVS